MMWARCPLAFVVSIAEGRMFKHSVHSGNACLAGVRKSDQACKSVYAVGKKDATSDTTLGTLVFYE